MALKAWPSSPPNWLLPWEIWQLRGKPVGQRPINAPAKIPEFGWEFDKWVRWRRKSPPRPPRPDIITLIPQWAWPILKQIMIAVPLFPPPPPPPPPPTYVDSWNLPFPLMFTTWGHSNDWQTETEVREIASKMFNGGNGVKTVALQIGQYELWVPDIYREFGIKIALWGSPSGEDQTAIDAANADGYMPQVEGLSEYERARDNLINGVGAGISRATVTTLAGFENFIVRPDGSSSTTEVEAFIEAGCTRAIVECYKQGGPSHFPISRMAWSAGHRGFPYFSPLIGLYWDVAVDEYQPDLAAYGKQVGAYTAETMRPQDWIDFLALGI